MCFGMFWASLWSVSIAQMNNWGAIGQPCLTPDSMGISGPRVLLIFNFAEVFVCSVLIRKENCARMP